MIEELESRIAPAPVYSVTDLNGDLIKFTSTKGTLSSSVVAPYMTAPDGVHNVYSVLLNDPQFEGTNLTVTVTKHGGGDGHAIIGVLSAAGRHLGTVSIGADVGKIVAGDGSFTDNAIKTLTVDSIGRFGIYGNGDVNSKHSTIGGGVGSLTIKHDYNGALLEVDGKLAALTIGGSMIGGSGGGRARSRRTRLARFSSKAICAVEVATTPGPSSRVRTSPPSWSSGASSAATAPTAGTSSPPFSNPRRWARSRSPARSSAAAATPVAASPLV